MRVKCILALTLIAIISIVAIAQTRAAKSVPGFSFKSPGNLVSPDGRVSAAVAAMPLGKTMVITYSYDKAKDTYHYQSSIINKKGKASKPTTFFTVQTYPSDNVRILWIKNSKASNKANGWAIVYLLTAPYDEGEKVAYLYSIRLDSKGKSMGVAQKIASFKAIEPHHIEDPFLSVAKGSGSIMVTMSVVHWSNTNYIFGPRKSSLYAIQTDMTGKAKGSLQSFALPNGGLSQTWQLFTPLWNGKRWFVPMFGRMYTFINNGWKFKSSGVYLLSVIPSGNSLKAKLKKVYQTTEKYGGINNASFVPLADGTTVAKAPTYTLVFGTVFFDPNNTVPLEFVTTRLFKQTVSKKGSPKGAYKEIPLPKRKHAIKSFNESLYWQDEGSGEISNVALNADGAPVIAIFRGTRLTLKSNKAKNLYDTEFGIYRIDVNKGTVTATQWSNKNLPAGYLQSLQLLDTAGDMRGFANLYGYPGTNRVELFPVK